MGPFHKVRKEPVLQGWNAIGVLANKGHRGLMSMSDPYSGTPMDIFISYLTDLLIQHYNEDLILNNIPILKKGKVLQRHLGDMKLLVKFSHWQSNSISDRNESIVQTMGGSARDQNQEWTQLGIRTRDGHKPRKWWFVLVYGLQGLTNHELL